MKVILFFILASFIGTAAAESIKVYKSPYCGCCKEWMKLAVAAGHDVSYEHYEDLAPVKEKLGVPKQLGSCHTATAIGYFLEGHIPLKDVERLLKERPEGITGIAVKGMPQLSPGMAPPGAPYRGFIVVAVHKDGTFSKWAQY
jgi:hypothetical protein